MQIPRQLNQTNPIVFNPVDHFPSVVEHCDDRQLTGLTKEYLRRAVEGPKSAWDDCLERAAVCRAECRRRNLKIAANSPLRYASG